MLHVKGIPIVHLDWMIHIIRVLAHVHDMIVDIRSCGGVSGIHIIEYIGDPGRWKGSIYQHSGEYQEHDQADQAPGGKIVHISWDGL
jgi:hypothetical protein